MNYPKAHINQITDDFINEYSTMRNLRRLESASNIQKKKSIDSDSQNTNKKLVDRTKRRMSQRSVDLPSLLNNGILM